MTPGSKRSPTSVDGSDNGESGLNEPPTKRVRFQDDAIGPNDATPGLSNPDNTARSPALSATDGFSESTRSFDENLASLYCQESILDRIIKTSPIHVHNFILAENNTPQAEVELTSILWQKATDIRDEDRFKEFLRRCLSWAHFVGAEVGIEKYYPPRRWVKRTHIDKIIGMQLVGNQWMVCVQAVVRTWVKPEDWKGDKDLEDAIVRYCENQSDWSGLWD